MATGHSDDIEEERRLLYVAMTRAKDDLYLMLPQRFYVHNQPKSGDRHVYASRTRFITGSMLDAFEQITWPAAGRRAKIESGLGAARAVDLKARVSNMWKAS